MAILQGERESRRQPKNVLEGSCRIGHVPEGEKIRDRLRINLPYYGRMLEERFDLRTEDQGVANKRIVQRLLAHPVARHEKLVIALVPDCKCEHPTKSLDTSLALFLIEMSNGLSITARRKHVTAFDQRMVK